MVKQVSIEQDGVIKESLSKFVQAGSIASGIFSWKFETTLLASEIFEGLIFFTEK